jgi:uncharacterized protein (DUF4415 family)
MEAGKTETHMSDTSWRDQMSDMKDIGEVLRNEADRMEKEADVDRRYVRTAAPRNPSQVYSIRIPVELLEQLRQIAAESQTPTTAMLRQWILDRLAAEPRADDRLTSMSVPAEHSVEIAVSKKAGGPGTGSLLKELERVGRMRRAA